jgi:hypothetical protein
MSTNMPEGPILSLMESRPQENWNYESASSRIAGAFRGVSVEGLLVEPPSILLYQWKDLVLNSGKMQQWPRYAAISHIWKYSRTVEEICEEIGRPLGIEMSSGGQIYSHETSWHGLVQAAHAARVLGCYYLWLDLLCIDQCNQGDKGIQVKNMIPIFERCQSVLIMMGGVGAAQGIDKRSSWIDRAWTLPEASLCKQTYALIEWPFQDQFYASSILHSSEDEHYVDSYVDLEDDSDDSETGVNGLEVQFIPVIGDVKLISLVCLLELDLTSVGIDLSSNFRIRCFEGEAHAAERNMMERNPASLALLAVLTAKNEHMKHCAVWRSMLLRTSLRAQDIVFSALPLLGIEIKVDYHRSLHELYLDLVMKAAIKGIPAWLSVGSSDGDIIPRDRFLGLCSELPDYERRLPFYHIRGTSVSAANLISRSMDYISIFDIHFMSIHRVCCRMLDFRLESPKIRISQADNAGEQRAVLLSVSGARGICSYKGKLGQKVIVIGRLASLSPTVRRASHNSWYVYFVENRSGGWVTVGAGSFSFHDGDIPPNRTHISFGQISEIIPGEDCDCSVTTEPEADCLPLGRASHLLRGELGTDGVPVRLVPGSSFEVPVQGADGVHVVTDQAPVSTASSVHYFEWTTGGDRYMSHIRWIDSGAFGLVHEVISSSNHSHPSSAKSLQERSYPFHYFKFQGLI